MTKTEASNIIDSSIAATVARLCTHPLDTIRVRLQTASISFPISSSSTFPISSVLPKSIISIKNSPIIQLIRTTPFKSYYSGISIATILGIPALSSYLFIYDNSKYFISEKFGIHDDKMINHMISGALAEIVSGVFWTPMEVIKSKLQMAASISNILDVVKTRWQVSFIHNITGNINNLNLNSPKEIIKNMYYNEGGLKAFTKGMGARVMWMVPASAISMTVFETLKNRRKKEIKNNI
ncbi:397_t:CDS:2 [Diversispora eburnea]|uniref:397_t:CDS:1 n=1 Tax=Diversispora eburnea TaxID=1213867 RepID=A0A9N9ACH1_9GLOM|nr:397_t:CDS:2 [Diversispora eburnea]